MVNSHNSRNREIVNELDEIRKQRDLYAGKLSQIYKSRGWKLLNKYYSFRDIVHNHYKRVLKYIYIVLIVLNNLLSKTKKTKINYRSKKIIYIGHSYHSKTKSTAFLLRFLKKYFSVKIVWDDSWKGKQTDLSLINEEFLAVIFFQNLPSKKILKSIKNKNIIFFPMYDSMFNIPTEDYDRFIGIKIVNFSRSLHKKFARLGFDSLYIKYFPKASVYTKNNQHKIFFWQRVNNINLNLIDRLFKNLKVSVHIHNAIDPSQKLQLPSKKQLQKYNISFSSWLRKRKEMHKILQDCDIYLAPREFEGIGLSFLEAMSMGKVVVAANNPTMNEYITNNETGYLFDPKNPKPIDFLEIEKIGKNAYEYIKKGNILWEKDKYRIIEFIKK